MFFFFIFLNWTSHFTVLETLPSSVYPFAKHTVVQVFWWYRIRAWRELRHDIELCRPVISKGDQINLFHKKSPSSIFLWYSCLNISRKISDSRFIHLTKGNGLPLLMRRFPTNTPLSQIPNLVLGPRILFDPLLMSHCRLWLGGLNLMIIFVII